MLHQNGSKRQPFNPRTPGRKILLHPKVALIIDGLKGFAKISIEHKISLLSSTAGSHAKISHEDIYAFNVANFDIAYAIKNNEITVFSITPRSLATLAQLQCTQPEAHNNSSKTPIGGGWNEVITNYGVTCWIECSNGLTTEPQTRYFQQIDEIHKDGYMDMASPIPGSHVMHGISRFKDTFNVNQICAD